MPDIILGNETIKSEDAYPRAFKAISALIKNESSALIHTLNAGLTPKHLADMATFVDKSSADFQKTIAPGMLSIASTAAKLPPASASAFAAMSSIANASTEYAKTYLGANESVSTLSKILAQYEALTPSIVANINATVKQLGTDIHRLTKLGNPVSASDVAELAHELRIDIEIPLFEDADISLEPLEADIREMPLPGINALSSPAAEKKTVSLELIIGLISLLIALAQLGVDIVNSSTEPAELNIPYVTEQRIAITKDELSEIIESAIIAAEQENRLDHSTDQGAESQERDDAQDGSADHASVRI